MSSCALAEGDASSAAKGAPPAAAPPTPTDAGDTAPHGPTPGVADGEESLASGRLPDQEDTSTPDILGPNGTHASPDLLAPTGTSVAPDILELKDTSMAPDILGPKEACTTPDLLEPNGTSMAPDILIPEVSSMAVDLLEAGELSSTDALEQEDSSTSAVHLGSPTAQSLPQPEDFCSSQGPWGAERSSTASAPKDATPSQDLQEAEDASSVEDLPGPEVVCATENTSGAETASMTECPSAKEESSPTVALTEPAPPPCAASGPGGDPSDWSRPQCGGVASTPYTSFSAGVGSLNPNCLELTNSSYPDQNETGYRPCRKAMKPPGGESRDLWGAEFKGTPCHHRVLKPPGGGSSDIFGPSEPVQNSPRRVRNNLQSSVFGPPTTNGEATPRAKPGMDSYNRLFGPADLRPQSASKNRLKSNIILSSEESTSPTKQSNGYSPGKETVDAPMKDGNPVTGEGYAAEKQPSPVSNGQPTANGVNGAPASAPASAPAQRSRVPPGGFSSGLW